MIGSIHLSPDYTFESIERANTRREGRLHSTYNLQLTDIYLKSRHSLSNHDHWLAHMVANWAAAAASFRPTIQRG